MKLKKLLTEAEKVYIKKSDIMDFANFMNSELVYEKNGKLYQDFVDENSGEETTEETSLDVLYKQFKKKKTRNR